MLRAVLRPNTAQTHRCPSESRPPTARSAMGCNGGYVQLGNQTYSCDRDVDDGAVTAGEGRRSRAAVAAFHYAFRGLHREGFPCAARVRPARCGGRCVMSSASVSPAGAPGWRMWPLYAAGFTTAFGAHGI